MPARQHWSLKGNDTMIRAIGCLSASDRAGTRIEIVDWGVDVARTRALVESLGLSPITTYRSLLTKTELWEACGRAGTIVLDQVPPYPVYGGGIGGVARDALAAGSVVVTHAEPDAQRQIFGSPPPVWHVDPTVESVANALREVLGLSDAEQQAIGERGVAWLYATADKSAVLPRYVGLHQELAAKAQ